MKTQKNLISKTLVWVNIISLLVFIFILLEVFYNGFFIRLDPVVNSFMSYIKNSFLTNFSIAISFIFDIKIVIIISFILSAYLWVSFLKKDSVFFIFTVGLNGFFLYVLKELIQRARPLNAFLVENGFSFPSGHASTAVVFFGLLIYLISRKNELRSLRLISILVSIFMILSICFARLYLNVHWFSDVLGGIATGVFILTGCILLKQVINKR